MLVPGMNFTPLDLVASIFINEPSGRPEKTLVDSKFKMLQKITKMKFLRHGLPILFFKTDPGSF